MSKSNGSRSKGRYARRKGKAWERDVANLFKEHDIPASRCYQFRYEDFSPDVEAGPFWVECKNYGKQRGADVFAAMEQVESYISRAKVDRLPLVFYKRTRRGVIVAMRPELFFAMLDMIRDKLDELKEDACMDSESR